jgi:ribosomal protein L5
MQTRYNFHTKYILQWKNININNSIRLLKNLQKPSIVLTFNLKNLKSKDYLILVESIYFLEVICGQRPYIKKLQNKKQIGKSGTDFKIQVNLHKFYAQNWLDLLKEFVLNIILKDESIKFSLNVTDFGNCSFILKDLSFIPGLSEEGLYWKIPLKVDILFNTKKKENVKLILEQLGFNNY